MLALSPCGPVGELSVSRAVPRPYAGIGYPSGGDRLAVRAYVAKGVTFELALRSCRDGREGSRGRAPTALEQGREVSDR